MVYDINHIRTSLYAIDYALFWDENEWIMLLLLSLLLIHCDHVLDDWTSMVEFVVLYINHSKNKIKVY